MFLDEEDLPIFFVMSTFILLLICLILWILWTGSTYLVNNILLMGPTGYIDDQLTLFPDDCDTDQEEMAVFTVESQF